MVELNLHGVKHQDVERLVENTVLLSNDDVRIITGNSTEMRRIVFAALDNIEVKYMTLAHNLGEVIALKNQE